MTEMSGLTVRQHERKSLNLSAEFVVADDVRAQVRFSSSAESVNEASVRGSMLDISSGGMGLLLNCFIPKLCTGTVRVYSHTPSASGSLGEPIYEPIFEHVVQVRRVYMASHEPTYMVGVSFLDPEPDLSDRVDEVLIAARALAGVTAGPQIAQAEARQVTKSATDTREGSTESTDGDGLSQGEQR